MVQGIKTIELPFEVKHYSIISFLKLLVSSLYGRTIEFSKIISAGTVTLHPTQKVKLYY